MKCPNCDFIEKDEAFGQPPTCPKCGAIYEKALRVRQLKELHLKKLKAAAEKKAQGQPAQQQAAEKQEAVEQPAEPEEVKAQPGMAASISAGIAEARAQRRQDEEDAALREVIVTDIRMPFWSMVVFMVKWVIAAIPAFIILAVVFSIVQAIPTAITTYQIYKSSSSGAKVSGYASSRTALGSTGRPSPDAILGMIKSASGNPRKPQLIQRDPYTIFLTVEKGASGEWRAGLVHEALSPRLMTGFIVITDCVDQYGIIEYSDPEELSMIVTAGKINYVNYRESSKNIKIMSALC